MVICHESGEIAVCCDQGI